LATPPKSLLRRQLQQSLRPGQESRTSCRLRASAGRTTDTPQVSAGGARLQHLVCKTGSHGRRQSLPTRPILTSGEPTQSLEERGPGSVPDSSGARQVHALETVRDIADTPARSRTDARRQNC